MPEEDALIEACVYKKGLQSSRMKSTQQEINYAHLRYSVSNVFQ
jgi:hypothetical protein